MEVLISLVFIFIAFLAGIKFDQLSTAAQAHQKDVEASEYCQRAYRKAVAEYGQGKRDFTIPYECAKEKR